VSSNPAPDDRIIRTPDLKPPERTRWPIEEEAIHLAAADQSGASTSGHSVRAIVPRAPSTASAIDSFLPHPGKPLDLFVGDSRIPHPAKPDASSSETSVRLEASLMSSVRPGLSSGRGRRLLRLQMLADDLHRAKSLPVVDQDDRFEQRHRAASEVGEMFKRPHFLGKAGTPITDAGLQERSAHARIEVNPFHTSSIGSNFIARIGRSRL
jgi:hypothetical protein